MGVIQRAVMGVRLNELPLKLAILSVSSMVLLSLSYKSVLTRSLTETVELSPQDRAFRRFFMTNTSFAQDFKQNQGKGTRRKPPQLSHFPNKTHESLDKHVRSHRMESEGELTSWNDENGNHFTVVRQSEILQQKDSKHLPPWKYQAASPQVLQAVPKPDSLVQGQVRHRSTRISRRSSAFIPQEVLEDTGPSYNVSSDMLCPPVPPGLEGLLSIYMDSPTFSEIEENHPELQDGGWWKPSVCRPRHRVALIVPYRDREEHLRTFLAHLHPYLQKQQIEYGIFIIEQDEISAFNRAMLFNIGFVEASKRHRWDCFIFHDVDLLPEDDRNLYTCPVRPRHMSVGVDKFGYRLPYPEIFGGVIAMHRSQFEKVNGFSNMYFGWGAEDDDMFRRLLAYNMTIKRYPLRVARYKMMAHEQASISPKRYTYLNDAPLRIEKDGINSLKYKIIRVNQTSLFTLLRVSIDQKEVRADFPDLASRQPDPPVPFESPDQGPEAAELEFMHEIPIGRRTRSRDRDPHFYSEEIDNGDRPARKRAGRTNNRDSPSIKRKHSRSNPYKSNRSRLKPEEAEMIRRARVGEPRLVVY